MGMPFWEGVNKSRSGMRRLAGGGGGRFLSTPIASRRAFSFAVFSLLASLRRSARPESQDVVDDAIARRDSDSLTLTA